MAEPPPLGTSQTIDFWFTTAPTAVIETTGHISTPSFATQVGGVAVAPAPALIVTTADDEVNAANDAMGVYSLRECINYANDPNSSRPGGQWRIKFKDTLTGAIITLNPDASQGYGQLTLQRNVFVDGEDRGITIRRDPGTATKHRIFEVLAGTNARLKGLTLRNGELSNALARGGAVQSYGNLTVESCTFAQNKSINSYGGAVAAMGGSLTVTGSTFTGNSAFRGGAVYINDTVTATISSSSLVLNTTTDRGGGVYISNATVTLTGTDVNGNSAVNAGGGIHVSNEGAGGTTTLTLAGGTTVQNNQVTSPSGQGGGIYFGKGTIILGGATIVNNNAVTGPQMYRVNGTSLVEIPFTTNTYQEVVGP